MLAETLRECRYPRSAVDFENAIEELLFEDDQDRIEVILAPLRAKTLAQAERCGKSRFAQIASKHVGKATAMPRYIKEAVEWIMNDE
jgi:putative ATP-dependent endonuclease of OLD family